MDGRDSAATTGRRRGAWMLVAGLAVLMGVAVVLVAARSDPGSLLVYRVAAGQMVHGEDMYAPTPDVAAFTYPPLVALPAVPLLPLPDIVEAVLWQFLNLLLFIGCLVLIRRCIDPIVPEEMRGTLNLPWYAYLLFALLAGRHLISPIESRSHDLWIFITMLLAARGFIAARGMVGGVCTGFWGGIAAALKATPLLLLPVLVWQRRVWASAAFVLVLTLGTLLPDLIFPRDDGRLWVVAWYDRHVDELSVGAPAGHEAWSSWNQLNQNLAGAVYRFSRSPEPSPQNRPDVSVWQPSDAVMRGVTLALQVGLLVLLAVATRPGRTRGLEGDQLAAQRIGEFSLVLCMMPLLSPMSSKAHFCVLGLPIAYCLSDFLLRRRSLVVGTALVIVFVFGSLTVKDLVGRRLGMLFLALGSVMWCTVALLTATTYVLSSRLREARLARQSRAEALHDSAARAPGAGQDFAGSSLDGNSRLLSS